MRVLLWFLMYLASAVFFLPVPTEPIGLIKESTTRIVTNVSAAPGEVVTTCLVYEDMRDYAGSKWKFRLRRPVELNEDDPYALRYFYVPRGTIASFTVRVGPQNHSCKVEGEIHLPTADKTNLSWGSTWEVVDSRLIPSPEWPRFWNTGKHPKVTP